MSGHVMPCEASPALPLTASLTGFRDGKKDSGKAVVKEERTPAFLLFSSCRARDGSRLGSGLKSGSGSGSGCGFVNPTPGLCTAAEPGACGTWVFCVRAFEGIHQVSLSVTIPIWVFTMGHLRYTEPTNMLFWWAQYRGRSWCRSHPLCLSFRIRLT